jgi:class 3 adenylate cyclase
VAAIEIQNSLFKLNEAVLQDRRMFFRIGINLGGVMERGSNLFGDDVNIAARIQSPAEPGGVCISNVIASPVIKSSTRPLLQ